MKWILAVCFTLCVFNEAKTLTSKGIDFYKEAQNENFNAKELELLKPFIDYIQTQYDQILSKETENLITDDNNNHLKDLLLTVLQHSAEEDAILDAPFHYDTNILAFKDYKDSLRQGIPSDESHDIENILQENIDEAHHTIQSLVKRAYATEDLLITINKIKILKFIYRVLGDIFSIAITASRAAYCTYSHIPIINETLTEGRANIGSCYLYTRNSIRHLRNEVQTAINDIRDNVVELVTIYKKVTSRQSLLGKLFTLLMNVSKITSDINGSRSTAYRTIEEVKNEVPTITATTTECATNSVPSFVKQLNETITGLMTCINFIDDSTQGPEPEPESSEESSEDADRHFSQRIF